MARVKTGIVRRRRHKKILKLTKGQYGTRSKLFRRANEAMMNTGRASFMKKYVFDKDIFNIWRSFGKRMAGISIRSGVRIPGKILSAKNPAIRICKKIKP